MRWAFPLLQRRCKLKMMKKVHLLKQTKHEKESNKTKVTLIKILPRNQFFVWLSKVTGKERTPGRNIYRFQHKQHQNMSQGIWEMVRRLVVCSSSHKREHFGRWVWIGTISSCEAIVGDLRNPVIVHEGRRNDKHVKDLMALELQE